MAHASVSHCGRTDDEDRGNFSSKPFAGNPDLAGRLDDIAVGPPGHQAVLQPALRRQRMGKPKAHTQHCRRNHQSCDRATAIVRPRTPGIIA
jgi:hypothetical protein